MRAQLEGFKAAPAAAADSAPSKPMAKALRSLFEQALAEHGAVAVETWLRYAACHLARGDYAASSTIYRRALASLSTELHAPFAAAYTEQLHG